MTASSPVALVTGAAKRVGRAIASELARAGHDIAIHFRESQAEAAELAGELSRDGRHGHTIQGDLSDPKAWSSIVAATIDHFGRLDVLVNNASQFLTEAPDTLEAFDVEAWERMLRINLLAPVGLCHHAAPYLAKNGKGCIVNLCDIAVERPWPNHLAYVASKAGLVTMTQALARVLAPHVRVNGVAPGIAVFPESYTQALRDSLIRRVPLARGGTPEDVARTVRFLVDSAPYITGQIISVDGGRSIV